MLLSCSKEPKFSNDEKHDINLLETVLPALRANPDTAFSKCKDFITTNGKEICYTTYLGLKASKNESVDKSVCQYINQEESKSLCLDYTANGHNS